MINEKLKVFILEDLKTDLELLKRQVLKYNDKSTFTVANNRATFFEKIEWMQPDIILSDYELGDFNGLEALLYVKQHMPDVPFIFVSGTLNDEEKVAKTILDGASGFVIKQNLKRLPVVLKEVIDENNARLKALREKAEAERQQKMLVAKLEAKIIQMDNSSHKTEALQIVRKLHVVK